MKKTILFTVVGFVVGLAFGCLGAMAYYGYSTATFMLTSQEKEIIRFEWSAEDAYYNQPTEVAIWALENLVSTLNSFKEERPFTEVEVPYFLLRPDHSLVFSHARLGQLYKKLDNTEKYKYHFDLAMSLSKENSFPSFDTEEELINFIHKVDSAREE